jgi:hypothetical protein
VWEQNKQRNVSRMARIKDRVLKENDGGKLNYNQHIYLHLCVYAYTIYMTCYISVCLPSSPKKSTRIEADSQSKKQSKTRRCEEHHTHKKKRRILPQISRIKLTWTITRIFIANLQACCLFFVFVLFLEDIVFYIVYSLTVCV